MRILFFHQIYKTPEEGGGIRSWYVANALAKNGHDVTVITVAQSETLKTKNEPEAHSLIRTSHSVVRLPIKYSNKLSFSKRIWSFMKFLWLARKESQKPEYDLIYAISVPLTTGLLALWSKKPYVFEVGDLWPDVPIQMGILKNPILKCYMKRLEKKIYKNAGIIISLSPDIQRNIYSKVNSVPNIVVPNFTDEQLLKTGNENRKTEEKQLILNKLLSENQNSPHPILRTPNLVICSYIGTAGMANDLMQMVELAKISREKHPEILFCMMIEGMEEEKIYKAAPENMVFIPYGSKSKVADLLSITDFNFVCYAQYSLLGTGSPNKFFDGLAAGCITVMNVKGWISELLKETNSGLFWNSNENERFLKSLLEMKKSEFENMKMRSLELSKQFDKDLMCEKIVKQIELRFNS